MKRLLFVLGVVLAVVLTNCTKPEDEFTTSPQNAGTLKDNPNNNFVPISGTLTGEAYFLNPIEGGNHWTMNVEGNVSHLGNAQGVMDFNTTTIFSGNIPIGGTMTGTGIMTAANGDKLTCTFNSNYTFDYTPPQGGIINNFTGGGDYNVPPAQPSTGRFEDAEGSFTAVGTQDMTAFMMWQQSDHSTPPPSVPTTMVVTGTINY